MPISLETERVTRCIECGASLAVPVLTGPAACLNSVAPVCDECAGVLDGRARARDLAARMEARRGDLIALGLLGRDSARWTFERSEPGAETANAAAWAALRSAEALRCNAYLFGACGTGKTVAGRCVLNRALDAGMTAAEVSGRAFLLLADRFDAAARLDRLYGADVLLLDDLDKGDFGRRAALAALWELFDRRQGRATLVTANVAPKDLRQILTERAGENSSLALAALERFGTGCKYLRFGGPNLRRPAGGM